MSKIILVMLLWAGCFPLISIGIQYSPHLTFASLRAVLAGVILTGLALALGRPWPNSLRVWAMVAAVGFGATSFGFLGMFHAAEFISPGIAAVIANTQPLLAAVLATLVLSERLDARARLGLVLGFLGILVITAPQLLASGQPSYLIGVAYIVMAAVGITVSNVLIKRISGDIDALMAMGLQILIGSVPLIIAAWLAEDFTSVKWSVPFISSLLVLSILGTAFVYWLWFRVLENVPLTRANVFSFLVPIFGLTIGALFYGERLAWPQILGVVLTIVGVSLVARNAPGELEVAAKPSAAP